MTGPTISEWQVQPGQPGLTNPATGERLEATPGLSADQVRAAHEAAALALAEQEDAPSIRRRRGGKDADTDAEATDGPATTEE